ncbi:MAG: hypothetical protein AAF761_08870, partial [Pseudomonadota bacterium]
TDQPLKKRAIKTMTQRWIKRVSQQVEFMRAFGDIPFVNYDDFCADPTVVNRALDLPVVSVDGVEGKQNTKERSIKNMAPRTIPFLSSGELDQISEFLEPHADIVEAIGYGIEKGETLIERCFEKPAMVHAALQRRIVWQSKPPKPEPAETPDA